MKICITLDDVIRAKTAQFGKIYKKFVDNDIDLDSLDISSGNLSSIFKFGSDGEYNKFLYEDYAFDIFAEAPVVEKMLDKNLNLWMLKNNDVDFMLGNTMEFNASIGFTYFFLSQIATRVREVCLPTNSSTLWDKCDVIVTADNRLIKSKPDGKVCVKIETEYNKDNSSDFTYDSLSSLISDDEFISKLKDVLTDEDKQA